MALLSIVPLAAKSSMHKSFISSAHEIKPFRRTIPTLGGKTVRAPISMCSATAVSGDGVQRRIANHHSNLWDDDFIQSLSTPFEVIFIFELILLRIPSFETNEMNTFLFTVLNVNVYGPGTFIP
jgi:hypothetical protein